jgi:hypothetical protein
MTAAGLCSVDIDSRRLFRSGTLRRGAGTEHGRGGMVEKSGRAASAFQTKKASEARR